MLVWVWQIVLFMISATVVVSVMMETYLNNRERKRTEEESKTRTLVSRILFTRNFPGTTNEVTDSLIDYISNINTVSQLKYTQFYVMDTDQEFDIHQEKHITGQVQKVVLDESTGAIKHLSFFVQSYALSIVELREWVNDVHGEYTVNKNNELGSRRYFFSQLPEKQQRGDKKLHLNFDMSQFETTKTLDNLYGDHIDRVQTRIELFQNKAWYMRNGVPHTLGILLYGEPGCGKTSLIKAIAHDTNRHVFNIRLTDNMTKDQLSQLFFDHKVHVRNKENSTEQMITIPLNQRLYVLEDIDCAENTVLSREITAASGIPVTPRVPAFAEGMFGERELDMIKEQVNKEKDERIDLAFLLNILDGVLETPQRLIIMTTNYPSKLDAALLRPGRIDLMLEFKKCSVEMLLTMVQNFYEDDEVNTSPLLDERLNELLTPAEVQEVLCNYIEDGEGAVQEIKSLAWNKIYKLSRHPVGVRTESQPQEPVEVQGPLPTLQDLSRGGVSGVGTTVFSNSEQAERIPQDIPEGVTRLCAPAVPAGFEECEKGELSTNFLPAADTLPTTRREPKWLKYQM